ncbi:hypothetical protein [uncultured Roseobacter sp.]|uniref:hypothetical protein n=1 Tax=uncultured Roseobacter sp. TaxID=114847 RepID=UPI002618D8EE|nr:hypothetical protein [uncultured Roseobacter sp.]
MDASDAVRFGAAGIFGLALWSGAVAAACSGFDDPPASVGLEAVKEHIRTGDFATAFEGFEISDASKQQLAEGLEAVLPGDDMTCITIRRIRQNAGFISELFTTDDGQRILYWTVSREVRGDSFRMINFNYTDDFNDIKELLY